MVIIAGIIIVKTSAYDKKSCFYPILAIPKAYKNKTKSRLISFKLPDSLQQNKILQYFTAQFKNKRILMKNFKFLISLGVVIFIIIGTFSMTYAAPVSFLAFDGDNDQQVKLDITELPGSNTYQVEYSTNNTEWNKINTGSIVLAGTDPWKSVWLRIYDEKTKFHYTEGTLWFNGEDGMYGDLQLYNSVSVEWNELLAFTVTTPAGSDNVATPIPPSALLLGSGLIGLVAFRRKHIG